MKWTNEEIEILRANSHLPLNKLSCVLPTHSTNSIGIKRGRLLDKIKSTSYGDGICEVCKNNFLKLKPASRFCCKKCSYSAKCTGCEKMCKNCGRNFWATVERQRDKQRGKYCSKKCFYEDRLIQTDSGRTCSKCLIFKPLKEFSRKSHESNRVSSYCSLCRSKTGKIKIYSPHHRFIKSKNRAKYRSLNWDISEDVYKTLIMNQCYYCDGNIELGGTGLDRKDNNKGYEVTNVVPCCKVCNVVKNNHFTFDEMLLLSSGLKQIKNKKTSVFEAEV